MGYQIPGTGHQELISYPMWVLGTNLWFSTRIHKKFYKLVALLFTFDHFLHYMNFALTLYDIRNNTDTQSCLILLFSFRQMKQISQMIYEVRVPFKNICALGISIDLSNENNMIFYTASNEK